MSHRHLGWAGKQARLNDEALELLVEALLRSTTERPAQAILEAWRKQYEVAATAEISFDGMPIAAVRDLADVLEAFLPEIERNMELALKGEITDLKKFRTFAEHVVKPTARDLLALIAPDERSHRSQ